MQYPLKHYKISSFMPHDTLSFMPEGDKTQELPGTPPYGPQSGATGSPLPRPLFNPLANSAYELSLISVLKCWQVCYRSTYQLTMNVSLFTKLHSDFLIQRLSCYTVIAYLDGGNRVHPYTSNVIKSAHYL